MALLFLTAWRKMIGQWIVIYHLNIEQILYLMKWYSVSILHFCNQPPSLLGSKVQNNREDFYQLGLKKGGSVRVQIIKPNSKRTRLSLCSKNCRTTFLTYSKFSSSSVLVDALLGVGDEGLEGVSAGDGEETETRESVTEPLTVSPDPEPPVVRAPQ